MRLGFQLEGASANNTVLYLDSYMNRDPRKNGESADGFACKEGSGAGNVLKGARLWNNVDDGLDLWYVGFVLHILRNIAFMVLQGVQVCHYHSGYHFLGKRLQPVSTYELFPEMISYDYHPQMGLQPIRRRRKRLQARWRRRGRHWIGQPRRHQQHRIRKLCGRLHRQLPTRELRLHAQHRVE